MEKVFFLYLKTGGGHISSCNALAQYINGVFPESHEAVLVDGFTESNRLVSGIVKDGYRHSQKGGAQWSYKLTYWINLWKPAAQLSAWLVSIFTKSYLEKRILAEQPEKIAVVHFLLVKPVMDIVKKHQLKSKVCIIVTDPYTPAPIWFLQNEPNYVVFSQRVEEWATKKLGIQNDQIRVFPFLLNERFQTRPDAEALAALKRKHGFSENRKIVTIMGGGDGMPRGNSIIKHLLEAGLEADLCIICGSNTEQQHVAEKQAKAHPNAKLIVLGYIDYVYEIMAVSDMVITKGGPSTVMEILMLGKIPVINNYIWGQEKGNVELVTDHNFGIYEKRIAKLPHLIRELLENETVYNSYVERINAFELRNGTPELGKYLAKDL